MRKYRSRDRLAWVKEDDAHLETIQKALQEMPAFVALLRAPKDSRYGKISPSVWLACAKGHPIRRVVIEVDPVKGATRNGVWGIEVGLPDDPEGNLLPSSQLTVWPNSEGWPGRRRSNAIWSCSWSDNDDWESRCENPTEHGADYCAEHDGGPEQHTYDYVGERRMFLRCPQGCPGRIVRRHTTLLVEVASALLLGKRTARLR